MIYAEYRWGETYDVENIKRYEERVRNTFEKAKTSN